MDNYEYNIEALKALAEKGAWTVGRSPTGTCSQAPKPAGRGAENESDGTNLLYQPNPLPYKSTIKKNGRFVKERTWTRSIRSYCNVSVRDKHR